MSLSKIFAFNQHIWRYRRFGFVHLERVAETQKKYRGIVPMQQYHSKNRAPFQTYGNGTFSNIPSFSEAKWASHG